MRRKSYFSEMLFKLFSLPDIHYNLKSCKPHEIMKQKKLDAYFCKKNLDWKPSIMFFVSFFQDFKFWCVYCKAFIKLSTLKRENGKTIKSIKIILNKDSLWY